MKKLAISRSAVLGLVAIIVVGIIGLVFVAPVIGAVVFVALVVVGAIAIGKREGGWRGFVAFAKDMIFGW
jgi:UPF0716 family protein affecting phage T7 exclusion